MVKLGISGYSAKSCMISLTSHQERVVFSKGNSYKKIELKKKLQKMEFLSGKVGSGMAGSRSSAAGWKSNFGVQETGAT